MKRAKSKTTKKPIPPGIYYCEVTQVFIHGGQPHVELQLTGAKPEHDRVMRLQSEEVEVHHVRKQAKKVGRKTTVTRTTPTGKRLRLV